MPRRQQFGPPLWMEFRKRHAALSPPCCQGELARRWLEENQAAIQAWNRHVAEHGLPLGRF
jgi:hypothetical protein